VKRVDEGGVENLAVGGREKKLPTYRAQSSREEGTCKRRTPRVSLSPLWSVLPVRFLITLNDQIVCSATDHIVL
jgi:hypothetical protein